MWKRWRNRGGRGGALFLKGKKCPLKYLWGRGVCQWFLIYTSGLKNCEKARVKSCTEITRGNCRNITGHQRNDVASKENFQFEPSSHPFFLLSPFFFFLSFYGVFWKKRKPFSPCFNGNEARCTSALLRMLFCYWLPCSLCVLL